MGYIVHAKRGLASRDWRADILALPASLVCGLINAVVLYLILPASLLLAMQVPLKRRVRAPAGKSGAAKAGRIGALILLFLAAVYGGYFGAGLSVIVIAVPGLVYADSLIRLNFLKQAIAFSVNITAAVYFAFAAQVEWTLVLVMSFGAMTGGWAGGKLAASIKPAILRWTVVVIGGTVAVIYLCR
jgi:uncharacterized membrane protein YfcA